VSCTPQSQGSLNLLELDNERAALLQLLDDVSPLKLCGAIAALAVQGDRNSDRDRDQDRDSSIALISALSETLEARLAAIHSSKDWAEYRRIDGADGSSPSPLSTTQLPGASKEKEAQGKGSGNGNGKGNGKKKETKKGKSSGKGRR
jgi:hypothetical protein